MCLFHKWSKWDQYVQTGTFIPGFLYPKNMQGQEFKYSENRQHRYCEKCNKVQDVKIEKD